MQSNNIGAPGIPVNAQETKTLGSFVTTLRQDFKSSQPKLTQ